jgi:hypothetical protein
LDNTTDAALTVSVDYLVKNGECDARVQARTPRRSIHDACKHTISGLKTLAHDDGRNRPLREPPPGARSLLATRE